MTTTLDQATAHGTPGTAGGPLVPLLCLLGAGALLGLSTDLAKLAGEAGLSPLAFLTWSVVGAALVLTAIGGTRGRLPTLTCRTVEYFVVAAFVSLAAPTLIFFSAVPHVGVSFVALSIAFPPLYTYLGALLLKMERFDPRRAAGVALALAGSALIAALALSEPDAPTAWIAITLCGPVLLAVGNIYRTRRWPPGSTPDQLAPGMLGAAAVMLLLVGAVPGFTLAVPWTGPGPVLLIVAQAAVFAAQYLLYFMLQQRGGPVYLSLLGSVAAIVGSAIAIALLGEDPPQGLAVGGVLIAGGIAMVAGGRRARRRRGPRSSWAGPR